MDHTTLSDSEKNAIEGWLVHNLHAVVVPNLDSCDLDGLIYNAVATLWRTGVIWKDDPRQKRELRRLYEKWGI